MKRPKIGLRLDPAAAAERNLPAVALTLSNDDMMVDYSTENMCERRATKRGKRCGRAKRGGVGGGMAFVVMHFKRKKTTAFEKAIWKIFRLLDIAGDGRMLGKPNENSGEKPQGD